LSFSPLCVINAHGGCELKNHISTSVIILIFKFFPLVRDKCTWWI
jgi:hypothetical protein